MIKVTLSYTVGKEKEKKKLNKFALINCILGIPTITFLSLLVAKGFLEDYLIIAYSAIAVLCVCMIYSIYKLIKG